MNNELCRLLNEAVENHNDYADESNFLYWWDVLNEIEDMTDDEAVMEIISSIQMETEKLMLKEAEGRNDKMKAVIFARGNNIGGQIAYCRGYAMRKGYDIAGVIVGQARELPEVINGLGKKIDLVIVKDLARISRDIRENFEIQTELEQTNGILVELASEKRNGLINFYMRNFLAAAEDESAFIRERVRRGVVFRKYRKRER